MRSWLAIGQRLPDGHLDTKIQKRVSRKGMGTGSGKTRETEGFLERQNTPSKRVFFLSV